VSKCKIAASLKSALPNPFTLLAILRSPTNEPLVLIEEVKLNINKRSCIFVLLFCLNRQATYTGDGH